MSTYRELIVTNPTIEELRASQVLDSSLDVLIVLVRDGNGRCYEVKYFSNDVHGPYVAVSNSNKDAQPHEVQNIARLIADSCEGRIDDRGVQQGHPEEIVHYSGRTQAHLAGMLDRCIGSLQEVLLTRAEYGRVPESAYGWTGFAPEKLEWRE